MNKDITTRADIEQLVAAFYVQVRNNAVIGPVFEAAITNWEEHLPTMYDFWEILLFAKRNYKGNPLLKHAVLHKKYNLTQEHFKAWVELWEQTLDHFFAGPTCEHAKQKAEHISNVMLSHFAPKTS